MAFLIPTAGSALFPIARHFLVIESAALGATSGLRWFADGRWLQCLEDQLPKSFATCLYVPALFAMNLTGYLQNSRLG